MGEAGQDCFILNTESCFRYRAGAVIVRDGAILMSTSRSVDYYYSIGGAVHLGETAEEAAVREVLEETGVEMQVDRLLFIHENMFTDTYGSRDIRWHEVALYFLMKGGDLDRIAPVGVNLRNEKENLAWLPFEDFGSGRIHPQFLPRIVQEASSQVRHIITIDDVSEFS